MPEVFYANIRSLLNKIDLLNFYMTTKIQNLMLVRNLVNKEVDDRLILTNKPYNIYRSDRTNGRKGGGTAVLVHSSITSSLISSIFNQNINHICLDLLFNTKKIRLIVVYVPPSSTQTNKQLDKLINILSLYVNVDYSIIIVGDFNLNSENPKTAQFLILLRLSPSLNSSTNPPW